MSQPQPAEFAQSIYSALMELGALATDTETKSPQHGALWDALSQSIDAAAAVATALADLEGNK